MASIDGMPNIDLGGQRFPKRRKGCLNKTIKGGAVSQRKSLLCAEHVLVLIMLKLLSLSDIWGTQAPRDIMINKGQLVSEFKSSSANPKPMFINFSLLCKQNTFPKPWRNPGI